MNSNMGISNETKHASLFVDFCAYGCQDDLDCVGVGTQKVVNFEGEKKN